MQDLKTLLERNIDLERQKLYKEQQHQAYYNQEALTHFNSEIEGIKTLFAEQNPLYHSFFLRIDVMDDPNYQVILRAVKEHQIQPEKQEANYYRGHLVKPASSEPKIEHILITELVARWLSNERQWAIAPQHNNGQFQIVGGRSEMLRYFLNIAVKGIARQLEQEANIAAAAQ